MIGSAGLGSGFVGLTNYLLRGDEDRSPERVAWTAVRNLPSENPELAPRIMRATADQNSRVKSPVYHLSISAPRGESFTPEQWQEIAGRVLKDLGLAEHQALLVAHRDTPNQHVHVMVNRVHPERLKVWKNSHDYPKIERSLRRLEREWGLREVPGRHYRLEGQERGERRSERTRGEQHQVERTGEQPWADRVRFQLRGDFQKAANWGELERALARNGLRLERRGGGLVVTDGRRRVKASRIDRGSSYARLTERFGMRFEDWRQQRRGLLDAVDHYQQAERRWKVQESTRLRAVQAVRRAEAAIRQRDRTRFAVRENSLDIQSVLSRLYKRRDLPKVRKRLVARARDVGWSRAAHELAAEPRRFGRLRHGRFRQLRDDVKAEVSLCQRAIRELGRHRGKLLRSRAAAGPPGFRALAQIGRLREVLKLVKGNAKPKRTRELLQNIATRAASLGLDAVKLAIAPNPWDVVRTAARAAGLLREAARGLDRGMER